MNLKGFGLFAKLLNEGHQLAAMGLHGTPGDVLRLSNRLRIVKSFRGLDLEGITAKTRKGYDGLTLVFLTHSALELYFDVSGQKLWQIEAAHKTRQAEQLLAEIFESDDRNGNLFTFLQARLNKPLQGKLAECRDKKCCNVGVVSSALRHIFVHGHLTANPNGMKPERVHRICHKVSTFLVEYINDEFFFRLREYARGKSVGSRSSRHRRLDKRYNMPSKTISINRAPVLTLWAAVVAQRLGFDEDEALTLGNGVLPARMQNVDPSLSRWRGSGGLGNAHASAAR